MAASGSDLTYQWRRDGANIAGANANSYTLSNVQLADDGAAFTVEVRNGSGSVLSAAATVHVAGPNRLSLLAGRPGGKGNIDGADGRLDDPTALTVGPKGLLYLVDSFHGTHYYARLRTVDPATGTIATVGSFSGDDVPLAMRFDQAGNRYDLTYSSIYKTTPAGERTLFVGKGQGPLATDPATNGVGTEARFGSATDMVMDAAGNLYVADTGSRMIRKVDPAGKVTTLAGNGIRATVDGQGSQASFMHPLHLAIDRNGSLIVLDHWEPYSKLRKIAPDGTVTTLPLKNLNNGDFFNEYSVWGGAMTFDAAGNLYLTDSYAGCQVHRVAPDGTVTDIAGGGFIGYADGTGAAARFCGKFNGRFAGNTYNPSLQSIATDAAGNLLLTDTGNSAVRRITPAGTVTTVAGRPPGIDNVDGTGAAAGFAYSLALPHVSMNGFSYDGYSLVSDAQGNLVVGAGDRLRKVASSGVVKTLPVAPGAPKGARYYPGGLASGRSALVVSDGVISRIDTDGTLHFLAGSPGQGRSPVDGTGADAVFNDPFNVIMDGLGNVYLLDGPAPGVAAYVERKITPDGKVTTLPFNPGYGLTSAWHADKDGTVWIAHRGGTITRTAPDGTRTTVRNAPYSNVGVSTPTAVTRDDAGNLYLAMDYYETDKGARTWSTVRRITPNGTETVVAGTVDASGVRLGSPNSLGTVAALAMGADGRLIILSDDAILQLQQ